MSLYTINESRKPKDTQNKKLLTRADIILIICLVSFALAAAVIYNMNRKTGLTVNVYIAGTLYESLSLDEDTVFDVDNDYGFNRIVISKGRAYVSEADCPDKICVSHSSIEDSGDTIICLPHKLVVEIR